MLMTPLLLREADIMEDLTSLCVSHFPYHRIHLNSRLRNRFNSSIHWLAFLNERYFFRRLWDPSEREKLQPALVLSALALATLLKSSEVGLGVRGRQRALWFRNNAQSYLEQAWSSSSVDASLAQAAMVRFHSNMSLPHASD